MKYTIEVIVGDNLIERVIECDYVNPSVDTYSFMISKKAWECDCGTRHSLDETLCSYPKSLTIIKEIEI